MGYRDYFLPKVKWARIPLKDFQDNVDGEEGVDGGSRTSSNFPGSKPNPQSKVGRATSRLVWLLHIALLGANFTWWLTWNSWMHPADSYSMYMYILVFSRTMANTKIFQGPLPQRNIDYEWSNFNVSLVMDNPFIQPWNDASNKAWMDYTEGGNSEFCLPASTQ